MCKLTAYNCCVTSKEMYSSKQICVAGKLAEYKGKPQIAVTKQNEIVLHIIILL